MATNKNEFITEVHGLKATTFNVRVRLVCPKTNKCISKSKNFKNITDARKWRDITRAEILQGKATVNKHGAITLAELIDRYIKEMGVDFRRSKLGAYKLIKNSSIAKKRIDSLRPEDLVSHGKERQQEKHQVLKNGEVKILPGAGKSTLAAEMTYLGVLFKWAKSNKFAVNRNLVSEAREDLKINKIVGKGKERNRRPTQDELDRLIAHFENPAQKRDVPLGTIMKFAIGTGLRLGEICSLRWKDFKEKEMTVLVRERKDPQDSASKNDEIALVWDSGYDTFDIVMKQKGKDDDFIFPYSGDTISSVFPRAVKKLGIKDLRFHDLRHEFCSRMSELGWDLPKIRVNSGHRDLKSLQRYLNIRPATLHREKPEGWIPIG